MSYDRNDRRPGGYPDDRARGFGPEYRGPDPRAQDGRRDVRGERFDTDRGGGQRDYGRDPRGYDYDDRGFLNRAGDEVRSWFGDDDAERRRQADERHYVQQERRYPDGGRFAEGSGYAGGGASGGTGNIGYAPSDYGAGRGAGATSNWGLGAGNDRNDWGRDPGYHSWRDRQIQSFDRDYDEYRREHQSKFDSEFHGWRQQRQGQRDLLGQVQEHFEVVGSDGQHVGTVDHVRGDHIKLTKTDKDAGGHHHSIPSSWIQSVESQKVVISKSADQAKAHWRDEDRATKGNDFFSGPRDRAFDRSSSGNS